MNRLILAVLIGSFLALSSASAAVAPSRAGEKGFHHVNAKVRASIRDYWDIDAWPDDLRLNVHSFGSSLRFNGVPFSGELWGSGSWFHFSGAQISGDINTWGGNVEVRAEVTAPNGSRRRRIEFTMRGNGPIDDPKRPPSFSVWSGDIDLDIRPVFDGREYSLSGWVNEETIGVEGTALACLATTLVMRDLAAKEHRSLPSSQWVEEAPLFRPAFR